MELSIYPFVSLEEQTNICLFLLGNYHTSIK